ncbi:Uncharacterized protein TCM_044666 [Theobroma cacao]|uniref:Uncharacterized protein n=1 Tax=Theobroma cacao TaxID=3641 RepID=A0A061FR31_THECC|nr:Uncharacterized protein TCM_044666 [Theobroma cacao]
MPNHNKPYLAHEFLIQLHIMYVFRIHNKILTVADEKKKSHLGVLKILLKDKFDKFFYSTKNDTKEK